MKKLMFFSLLCVILSLSSAQAYQGENFFIINWDGMRYDAIDDGIPTYLLDSLSQEGIFFNHLYNAWTTITSPGHANIHTGNPQYYPNSILYDQETFSIHYLPSLMESMVKERGTSAADSVMAWIFGNSSNDYAWGYSRHPDYPDTDPSSSIHAARDIRHRVEDYEVWEDAIKPVLEEYQPSLFYVDFHQIDHYGHKITPDNPDSGIANYLDKIRIVDSLTWVILKDYIPNSPKYRDKTNVLIISDHGRHTDGVNSGLKSHGCDCDGCRKILGFLWGPDFRDGLVIDEQTYQTDFAHTIAHLLNLKAPHARSSMIHYEWLENPEMDRWTPLAGGGDLISDPDTYCSYPDFATSDDGRVHAVWCQNDREVVYAVMENEVWSNEILYQAGDEELIKTPRIAVLSDTVAVCWERYKVKCTGFKSWYLEITASHDGGLTWSAVSDRITDRPVLFGDIAINTVTSEAYLMVSACHLTQCGSKYPMGNLSIFKRRPKVFWKEKAYLPISRPGAQRCNISMQGPSVLISANCFLEQAQAYEIMNLLSLNHGKSWYDPNIITEDNQVGYYAHDYAPSSLIVEAPPEPFGRSVETNSSSGLLDIHPNPFNSATQITLNLPNDSDITLEVYNLLGQKVATLNDGFRKAGKHSLSWDASGHSSGVYLYKLTAGDEAITGRMTLLK
ncbi:MAG: T9SS type A sorting domain-containing protein [candidate division Zixibacteria bacterium]|nr:T9SS type A sorting domain-containing protein [candidate division Zixibacteria bacterium]